MFPSVDASALPASELKRSRLFGKTIQHVMHELCFQVAKNKISKPPQASLAFFPGKLTRVFLKFCCFYKRSHTMFEKNDFHLVWTLPTAAAGQHSAEQSDSNQQ